MAYVTKPALVPADFGFEEYSQSPKKEKTLKESKKPVKKPVVKKKSPKKPKKKSTVQVKRKARQLPWKT